MYQDNRGLKEKDKKRQKKKLLTEHLFVRHTQMAQRYWDSKSNSNLKTGEHQEGKSQT